MSFPDPDEIKQGVKYPDRLYLDSDWMLEIYYVTVHAEGMNIEFKRRGHNIVIFVSKEE